MEKKSSKNILKILIFSVFGVVIGFALGYLIFYNEGTALFGRDSNDSSNVDDKRNEEIENLKDVLSKMNIDSDDIEYIADLELSDSMIYSLSLKTTDYDYFISASDSDNDGEFSGAIYNSDITDEYKIGFSLNELEKVFDWDRDPSDVQIDGSNESLYVYCSSTEGDIYRFIKISLDALESLVNNYFYDFKLDSKNISFSEEKDYYMNGFNNLIDCGDYYLIAYAYSGTNSNYNHYEHKILKEEKDNNGNTIIEVVSLYFNYYDNYEETISLYDYKGGNLITDIPFGSDFSWDDDISYDELTHYTYTFNGDGQLVSVVAS